MAFNGTAKFEKQKIVNYLEGIGMKFGPDLNAYTSFDETVYMLKVPTDDAVGGRRPGWRFSTSGLTRSRCLPRKRSTKSAASCSRSGARAEGRGSGSPTSSTQCSGLARATPTGCRSAPPRSFKKAPRAALVRYYKDWYRPDLMAVVAVGDFDGAEMERKIKAQFADLAKPGQTTPSARRLQSPSTRTPGSAIETDSEMTNTTVRIVNKLAKRLAKDRRRLSEVCSRTAVSRHAQQPTVRDRPQRVGAVHLRVLRDLRV